MAVPRAAAAARRTDGRYHPAPPPPNQSMRIFPLLVSLALLSSLPAQRPEKGGKRDSAPVELANFTFQTRSFKSEALGRDVPYGIYLPKGYDDETKAKTTYPLVIWLHGMREDHTRF